MQRVLCFWFLCLLGAEVSAQPVDRLIPFSIEDQFERAHDATEFADQVAVFLWADRKGGDHIDAWVAALRSELAEPIEAGSVHLRGVAHVKGAPFFVKGRIRRRFGDDPKAWTLLDWKGEFEKAYAPAEDHIVILVFDREGVLREQQSFADLDDVQVEAVADFARQLARE